MKTENSPGAFRRFIYFLLGFVFLALSVLGGLFPIIPGFLFLIPAILFFAKASRTFRKWIRNTKYYKKYFGDHIPYKNKLNSLKKGSNNDD